MPLNVDGDPGYGSVAAGAGPGLAGSLGGSETVPLLIPEPEPEPLKWQPMSKEQLEIAAGGPRWRKLRSRLVLMFWLCWLAMLGASIAIIVQSPRPIATPLLWWQKALFYRLQPAVFTEAETGGARGISVVREQLPYLQNLGVGALVLEGLFNKTLSPPDLTDIDDGVGTVPQVQQLLMESHKAGLKVVLDLCDLDLSGPQDPAGNDSQTPSDPVGTVQYGVRYWLEKGVSGFSICDTDAAFSEKTLMEWRVLVKEFSTQDDERIVVVRQTGEFPPAWNTSSPSLNSSLVEMVTRLILPLSHHLLTTQEVAVAVETHLLTPKGAIWPSWTVGGEVSLGLRSVLLVLMMTLPGSPMVKYGEEITYKQNVSVNMGGTPVEQTTVQGGSPLSEEKRKRSAVALFSSLSHSRAREEALIYGSFTFLPFNTSSIPLSSSNSTVTPVSSPPILAFLRSWGCVHFLVLLNLGSEPQALDPAWAPSLPSAGVFVTSTGMDRLGATSLETLMLQPQEAIVIKLFETGSYGS